MPPCVASLSRHLLDSGFSFCPLFADLANPTSNHLYKKIGYRPICDFVEWRLAAASLSADHGIQGETPKNQDLIPTALFFVIFPVFCCSLSFCERHKFLLSPVCYTHSSREDRQGVQLNITLVLGLSCTSSLSLDKKMRV